MCSYIISGRSSPGSKSSSFFSLSTKVVVKGIRDWTILVFSESKGPLFLRVIMNFSTFFAGRLLDRLTLVLLFSFTLDV